MPAGLIVMWSGLKANIPSGWNLCDGTLGTPDLRDKFILSVNTDEPGSTGGTDTYSHSGATVQDHPATATSQADAGAIAKGSTANTLTQITHKHNTPILTHTVGQANDHTNVRPPYFKLAFIMKA